MEERRKEGWKERRNEGRKKGRMYGCMEGGKERKAGKDGKGREGKGRKEGFFGNFSDSGNPTHRSLKLHFGWRFIYNATDFDDENEFIRGRPRRRKKT